MTEILRGQQDGIPEHVLSRAKAVRAEDAERHPLHKERIAAAKAAIEMAADAVAAGAGSHYEHQGALAKARLAQALGDASIAIAIGGQPVAREEAAQSGRPLHMNTDDPDTQEAIAGVEFMRKLRQGGQA